MKLLANLWKMLFGGIQSWRKRSSVQEVHNPSADIDMYPWALDSRPWNNYSNRGSRNVPWEGKEMSNDVRPRHSRIEFKTHCLCIGGIWAHTGKGVSFQLGNEWSLKEGLMNKAQLSNIPTGYTTPFTQPYFLIRMTGGSSGTLPGRAWLFNLLHPLVLKSPWVLQARNVPVLMFFLTSFLSHQW